MDDLKIDPLLLDEKIKKLVKDNEDIHNTIIEINNIIKGLDEGKWKSPEKNKIDNELIPYLDYQEYNIYNGLSNCLVVIDKAKETYLATNKAIGQLSETLSDYDNLGDV